jgi:fibro-slime domain-containing protein
VYPLALFFAERHTSSSTFRIDTTIAEFNVCPDR